MTREEKRLELVRLSLEPFGQLNHQAALAWLVLRETS